MSSVVLDASAVLAYVLGEPGKELVAPRMTGGLMSAVNYSEVLKKAIEYGGSAERAGALLDRAQVRVMPFDDHGAMRAAELWPASKQYGLSLGDRACLALGMELGAEVLTTDRRMAMTSLRVKVTVIRGDN